MLCLGQAVRNSLAVTAAVGLLWGTRALADDQTDLSDFLSTYRCAVLGRLQTMYRNTNAALDAHRFIVVAREDAVQSYVQCIFIDHATRMLCEASSGYYLTLPTEPRSMMLPNTAKIELAALGFDTTEEQGNFKRFVTTSKLDDLSAVADLLLTALFRGYGARINSVISINAAIGPKIRQLQSCIPVS
jgi:hypothetical protein